MNAAQQELVRTTFARLAVMPEVAAPSGSVDGLLGDELAGEMKAAAGV